MEKKGEVMVYLVLGILWASLALISCYDNIII